MCRDCRHGDGCDCSQCCPSKCERSECREYIEEPVTDGIDKGLVYCSEGCRLMALVEMAKLYGCGAFVGTVDGGEMAS